MPGVLYTPRTQLTSTKTVEVFLSILSDFLEIFLGKEKEKFTHH